MLAMLKEVVFDSPEKQQLCRRQLNLWETDQQAAEQSLVEKGERVQETRYSCRLVSLASCRRFVKTMDTLVCRMHCTVGYTLCTMTGVIVQG
eukprot:802388-Amphidinium_carterae.1